MGRKSKNYTQREKQQGRWFTCILYDSPETEWQLNRLPSDAGYWDEFYYIKHDQDVITENERATWFIDHNLPLESKFDGLWDEEKQEYVYAPIVGEKKKPHYHVVAYHNDPIILAVAATKFDVPSNRVQIVHKAKSAVRYLLHLDNPEKHKYFIEELITNNEARLQKFLQCDELTVMDKARIILECIEQNYNCSFLYLCQRMIDLGVYDEFRRGQHLYSAIIYELREQNKTKKERNYEEK